jgi:hypothetical protein
MKPERILNIKTRAEWRNWLLQNFNTRSEIWLVYAKKLTGREFVFPTDITPQTNPDCLYRQHKKPARGVRQTPDPLHSKNTEQ